MVAKSEASMPMSRALTKLAVATDLGTAARPSTAAPLCGPMSAAARGGGGRKGSTSGMATAGGSGRPLLFKPSAARAVLAAMPLAALDNALSQPTAATHGPPPALSPTTPRLPPLSPKTSFSGAECGAGGPQALTPPPLPGSIQAQSGGNLRARPLHPQAQHPHPQHMAALPHARPPLPSLAHPPTAASSAVAGSTEFGKELLDAAKKHPGLPASLLAQLHHHPPRGRSAGGAAAPTLASSSAAVMSHGSITAAAVSGTAHVSVLAGAWPSAGSDKAANAAAAIAATDRPLSPRTRARATASLTAAAPSPAQLPSPAAMATLSPEALAVLLGPKPTGPPPPSPGGSLVMRRSAPVVGSTGAPLRPSTSSGLPGHGASGPPGAPCAPARPHVVPHITVPYKPGSIRLPPGTVANPGALRSGAPAPAGSDSGTGQRPSTSSGGAGTASASAAAVATPLAGGELPRPWTSASALAGALRPPTANPLTHSMAPDPSASLVVRVPRPLTVTIPGPAAAAALAAALRAVPPPPSTASSTTTTTVPPGTASAPHSDVSFAVGSNAGSFTGSSDSVGPSGRRLTPEELRAVVVAVAAARPDAAALLLQRPSTAAPAAGAGAGASSRPGITGPGGSVSRRPSTANGGPEEGVRRAGSVSGGGAGSQAAARTGSACGGNGASGGGGRGSGGGGPEAAAASPPGSAPYSAGARPCSRCGPRGGSARGINSRGGTAAFDDAWPEPQSPSGSRTAGSASGRASSDDGGKAGSVGRPFSAWGTQRRPLQPIPEDAELAGAEVEEEAGSGSSSGQQALVPLETLDPDPDLDRAWAAIVADNQRPDTAALKTTTGSINMFSRPATGALRITRQAAPMVLIVEDITASTPEVLERELATMSLEELQAVKLKLSG